jgi:sulfur carrier protein
VHAHALRARIGEDGGAGMTISVNGQRSDLLAGEGLTAALARLGIEPDARGVAVAVDGEVVPRGDWRAFVLDEDARVEVLTAMQGG